MATSILTGVCLMNTCKRNTVYDYLLRHKYHHGDSAATEVCSRSESYSYRCHRERDTFKLAGQLPDSIVDGVNDKHFDDLEDSYQAHVAEEMCCDVLLTIDEKHFARFNDVSSVKVLTPQQFLELHKAK